MVSNIFRTAYLLLAAGALILGFAAIEKNRYSMLLIGSHPMVAVMDRQTGEVTLKGIVRGKTYSIDLEQDPQWGVVEETKK